MCTAFPREMQNKTFLKALPSAWQENAIPRNQDSRKERCWNTGKKEIRHGRRSVLTKTGKIPVNTARTSSTNTVNTARHNFNSQAVPNNAARKVNTVKPMPCSLLEEEKAYITVKMCDKKNKVLFTDSECLVLSLEFKLPDAFRVYNLETKRVEENLYITFLENKPNVAGKGPTWLFDLDYLTDSMNYQPVRSENQANKHAGLQEANQNTGTEDNIDAGDSEKEAESAQDYFVLPTWSSYTSTVKSSKASEEPTKHPNFKQVDKEDQVFLDELERLKRQDQDANDAAEALRKEFA
ncbi:hypothetical protein Tco_0639217 [Tanacetum coccineum]